MANRKLPFGYRMSGGQICIADAEAEVVRMMFASYGAGNSYETLTGWLNNGSVRYLSGKRWNKNAVARILQDERYLGNDTYPPILTAEEFSRRKPDNSGKLEHPQLKDIRILARCAQCGGAVRRERKNVWTCPHCTASVLNTTDKLLMDDMTELLRCLCEHPDAVAVPPAPDIEQERITAAQSAFDRQLEQAEFDESAAKTKAVALAAAQFDSLGSEDYKTMQIQHILRKSEYGADLNTALLRQISAAILIHPSGEVCLKLKNGQLIERTDFT